jgi:ribosomal protein L12E/L44/L45/RPP1/RPP2
MAVKPEIIKARLKVLFPKANLSTKRLDVYAAKLAPKPADDADDEAIDAIINDYNEVIDFVAVAAEDDRARTLEAAKNKADEAAKNKGGKKEEEEEEETEGMTPFEKKMLKNFGMLKSDIDSIKSGNVLETQKQTALQSFEKSEILKGLKPELKGRWLTRIDVNSETPIEDQIKELESEYSELVQVNADSNVYGGPAGGGSNNHKPDESIVSEIVDNLNI